MGNTNSEEQKAVSYPEGERHPVVLDPTMVYEVNVSGWFQWTDTCKVPHHRKPRSDDWKFSFSVSNCVISGREDTNSPITMKDGTQYKLSRALEGYFGEGEVKMLATYSDGTKTSFKGTYYGINNDVFMDLDCQMLEGGELGKAIFFDEGKGGGQCIITPLKSNLASTVEGTIRFFFQHCDFNVMEFFMSKLTDRELRALRLVTSWFKDAITYKFSPILTYKELREIESRCVGCYASSWGTGFLKLFDTHYEWHKINRELQYPIVGLWRYRRLIDRRRDGTVYRDLSREDILSPDMKEAFIALGGFGSNAWMDNQISMTLWIAQPSLQYPTYNSDDIYYRIEECAIDGLVKEARVKVTQEIEDEKMEVMKEDLKKVGDGVLTVAKVVGMAVTFPISVPIYYYLEKRDRENAAIHFNPPDYYYDHWHYGRNPLNDDYYVGPYNSQATPSTPLVPRLPFESDGF